MPHSFFQGEGYKSWCLSLANWNLNKYIALKLDKLTSERLGKQFLLCEWSAFSHKIQQYEGANHSKYWRFCKNESRVNSKALWLMVWLGLYDNCRWIARIKGVSIEFPNSSISIAWSWMETRVWKL